VRARVCVHLFVRILYAYVATCEAAELIHSLTMYCHVVDLALAVAESAAYQGETAARTALRPPTRRFQNRMADGG
jgi:hypothetical protein